MYLQRAVEMLLKIQNPNQENFVEIWEYALSPKLWQGKCDDLP